MVDSATGVGITGTSIEAVLAATQTNEILQAVQIVLAIISFLVTIIYTVWKWYKNATREDSDGGKKITKDEVSDLIKDVKEIKKETEDDRDKWKDL